ncbi:hypothetical protein PR048_029238 [Dryococelus australis]|uniref:Uncharacterized protein n=1 Tax=Dryococelus australis TaxID=614101 RepID=A0ABQ9GFD7_9NEOP|nr:hypothetical protein PR048_029238 [Dryococelus australis]
MEQQALQLLEESGYPTVKVIAIPKELVPPKGGQRSVLDAQRQRIIEENPGPCNEQVTAVGGHTEYGDLRNYRARFKGYKEIGGKNKHSKERAKEAVKHIDSFPKYVSHYCRSETDAKFLNEDLNLSTMYELYKSECNDPVSLSSYKSIFHTKFNLRFKSPKKRYTCELNIYNLGIHVGITGRRIFNIWLEHAAGHETQEIGSCLMKYIRENIHPPVNKLILWPDSRRGQNRSIRLILMLMYALQNHVSLESITLRFLPSGQSFLPNDSEFGDVECALKIQRQMYTDTDYMNVMKCCRKEKSSPSID